MAHFSNKLDSDGSASDGNNPSFHPSSSLSQIWILTKTRHFKLINVFFPFLSFMVHLRANVEPGSGGGHPGSGQAAADWASLSADPEGHHGCQWSHGYANVPYWGYRCTRKSSKDAANTSSCSTFLEIVYLKQSKQTKDDRGICLSRGLFLSFDQNNKKLIFWLKM